MNAKRILAGLLILAIVGILLNQWRLQHAVNQLSAALNAANKSSSEEAASALENLRQAEERYKEANEKLQMAEQRLASANTQLPQVDSPPRLGPRRPRVQTSFTFTEEPALDVTSLSSTKRSWGPEQAAGEPDTFQAGDISTAWASREPDGGEEWLKLDYEKSVDIMEVRVRETYNPGAISKVTALLANGTEMTLWEGIEPKSEAPVEMSFQVAESVNAKSIKVYLDTKRVPGWNEIDAVQLLGRDGSQQWAKQATASSTYAEPRAVSERTRLVEERF